MTHWRAKTDCVPWRGLQITWMVFWSIALAAIAVSAALTYGPQPVTFHLEPRPYVFKVPVIFLGCLEYEPADNETFADWDFEQPMRFIVHENRTVWFNGGRYVSCSTGSLFEVRP